MGSSRSSLPSGRAAVQVALLAAALVAAGLPTLLAPASAAPAGPAAVKGGAVQAWKATAFRPAAPSAVAATDLHFTGDGGDQTDKLTGTSSASFGRTAPSGTSSATQHAEGGVGDGSSDDPTTAYWTADYTGKIDGPVSFTWWWQTLDPVTASLNLTGLGIRVWADPGTPEEKLIGGKDVVMDAFGFAPTEQTATVPVKGVVGKRLRIQAIALFDDVGRGYRISYGSATHPSRFAVPTGAAAAAAAGEGDTVPTNPAVKETRPLRLSATDVGRKSAEPTIGITKEGNAFYAAATFDNAIGQARTKIFASYDGNRTWQDVSPRVAGESFPPATLDPYIYVDQETSRVYSDDLYVGCSLLQWSDDQGRTWTRGNPLACGLPVDDHQTIVTGNPRPGMTTSGYPNVLYYCTNKVAGAFCGRSLDGGANFQPAGAPAFEGVQASPPGFCGGLHGHIITDPEGRLYVPKGHCGKPWLAVSEDGGATWRRTMVADLPVAGIQTAVASDTAGNIYYLWWAGDTRLPYMAVSRDAGKTFGPALLVGPPGLQAVNFPSIDAGRPGQVAISYPGTTDAEAAKPSRPWNYYVAVTDDALAASPVFHSATANALSDPVHRGICLSRCAGMLDFLDVVLDPTGAAWATMVDTCTGECVTAKEDTLTTAQRPRDARGFAVRQLAGPGSSRPVAAPAAPGVAGGRLPATGAGAAGLLGAVLLVVALAWRRGRQVV